MKALETKGLAERWLWLGIIILSLAFAIIFGSAPMRIEMAGFVLAASLLLVYCIARKQTTRRDKNRPDGVLIIAASQVIASMITLAPDNLRVAIYIISSALGALGAIRIVFFRLGQRAEITERETAIVASGLAVTFYVLVVQPGADSINLAGSILTAAALSGAIFSMVLLLWLATFDTERISTPFALVLVPQALLVVTVADLPGIFDEGPMRAVLIFTSALPLASYLHPNATDAFSITIFANSEINVRRSLISFSVVLVGPILIAVNQFNNLNLSLPTITIGSSILSVMVATHLLLLVRRWADAEHQGKHDPLTGLPNRPLFFNRLETAIESAKVRDSSLIVMFLDLDRFKAVNDSLGHEKGDLLLSLVAERLDRAGDRIGKNVTVARLGGDEFGVVVPFVKDARHAHAIGGLLLDQFLTPFDMGLRDIYVTPSIGVAQYPGDGHSVKELIENADTAMFEAKDRGRNAVVAYSPDQRTPGVQRIEIEAGLHKALKNEELEVYYQPQVDVVTGRIFAVEALLRWEHPTLGLISPERFVPVAEESALIDTIGDWTLHKACEEAANWTALGLPAINVAVNLSPRQFQKSAVLTDNVARALEKSGLPPHRLELELTESLALERPEEVNATLLKFREMGIRTAIDDFGVGHTGLDYLDRITVDTLKIDRSFINRIGESGAPLVTAVISLARGLNLDVIAEGVETRAQVDFLRSHDCRYMQGYLFSRPLNSDQLIQVLRKQQARTGSTPAIDADAA